MCFCPRRNGASLQAATCHRSSQPRCDPTFRRSAGQVRRHPQLQRSIQIWRRLICGDLFSVELRRSARSLNLGMSCADTTLLGNLRDPVPKPTPPSDHIPLRRRCAFWCRPISTHQWPDLVFAVAWLDLKMRSRRRRVPPCISPQPRSTCGTASPLSTLLYFCPERFSGSRLIYSGGENCMEKCRVPHADQAPV